MNPKQVTAASGCKRWACRKCGLSSINRWTAMVCCAEHKEITVSDLPCDTEPSEHVLEESVTLGINSRVPEGFYAEGDDVLELPRALPEPKAAELLGRAARHMHDRASTYDAPEGERSMGKCVSAFNAVTGRDLRESEGWLMLALLKATRSEARSEPHQDSLEDLIAYSALYAEARGEGR